MQTVQQKYEEFRDHNKKHKIIIGEWLDKNKRSISSTNEMMFLRYTFENKTVRT